MSTIPSPISERVRFARRMDPASNACLQEAAASPQADRAEALLNKAARFAPESLAVDVARYKFSFYRGELASAEGVVRATLNKAATQGGFSADWSQHTAPLVDREQPESPARYYLYGLKALAFIRLRSGAADETAFLLKALSVLDPHDLVGASVIVELTAGIGDAVDAG